MHRQVCMHGCIFYTVSSRWGPIYPETHAWCTWCAWFTRLLPSMILRLPTLLPLPVAPPTAADVTADGKFRSSRSRRSLSSSRSCRGQCHRCAQRGSGHRNARRSLTPQKPIADRRAADCLTLAGEKPIKIRACCCVSGGSVRMSSAFGTEGSGGPGMDMSASAVTSAGTPDTCILGELSSSSSSAAGGARPTWMLGLWDPCCRPASSPRSADRLDHCEHSSGHLECASVMREQ